MNNEKKLEQEVEMFAEVAKSNKNVDVASLMMNALSRQDQSHVSSRLKKWAYLISIGLPPFGLLFAVKFYLSDQSDAKQTGHICVLLTILGFVMLVLFGKILFSSSGASIEQIQQINPSDLKNLYN